ncbi:MAG: glycosyltransferase family 39 protein [Candidatus Paceibacterota bacterium]
MKKIVSSIKEFYTENKKAILIILGLGIGIRLILLVSLLVYGGTNTLIWGDTAQYLNLAQNVVEGDGYIYDKFDGLPNAYRPPGYPAYLMPFVYFGIPLWVASIPQILLSTLVGVLVFFLARKYLHFGVLTSTFAGLLTVLEPMQAYYSVVLLPDILTTVLLLVGLLYIFSFLEKTHWMHLGIGAVLLGISLYIRPVALYLGVLLLVAYTLRDYWRGKIVWIRTGALLFVVVVMMFAMMPWQARNLNVFGVADFVSAGAYNFFTYGATFTNAVAKGIGYDESLEELRTRYEGGLPDKNDRRSMKNNEYYNTVSKEVILNNPVPYTTAYLIGLNTFFFSGNYHQILKHHGLIDAPQRGLSFSLILSNEGPVAVLKTLGKHVFTPYVGLALFGKIFWVLISVGAFIGMWLFRKHEFTFMACIVTLYFCATLLQTTMGVEARHRYTLNPLLFLYFSAMLSYVYAYYIRRRTAL